ncbi:hypothetical protein CDD83_3896 [Cordyceps sp. RAO-2017]|nr:hypothetical protein CDD83_3896 [Cordyceps sp. RAO-2017]
MARTQMHLEDWLDDLCVRFIINLPQEDLSSVARICFQVEEAQWFYEDFIRPLDPTLPSTSLRTFCLRIFQHCPLLASFSVDHHVKAFEEFLQYKTRVPVRGALMLNQSMDSVVLVKGWKRGASWSFPRGKINKDEDDLDCAIREVYEETGLDLRAAGLVPAEKKPKYIEISMREQQLRLYVFRGIPTETHFQPRTRKEISKIQWYKLSELPTFRKKGDNAAQEQNDPGAGNHANKFYMVAPFLVPLRKWIAAQMKNDEKTVNSGMQADHMHQHSIPNDIPPTEDDALAAEPPYACHQSSLIDGSNVVAQENQLQMQPHSQALARHEDKGSALLSILQDSGLHHRSQSQAPHTPLDLTFSQPPQPGNPHHRTNQHFAQGKQSQEERPPAFQLGSEHGPAPSFLPEHSYNSQQISDSALERGDTLYPKPQEASLVHPQPLPPQVQRDILHENAFQDLRDTHQAAGHMQQARMITVSQAQMQSNLFHTQSPQPSHLHKHSISLLNTLQHNATPLAPKDQTLYDNQSQTLMARSPPAVKILPYAGHVLPHGLSNPVASSMRKVPPPKVWSDLTRSGGQAFGDHRSALLDMFRKGESLPQGKIQSARDETVLLQQPLGRKLEFAEYSGNQFTAHARAAQLRTPIRHSSENKAPRGQARDEAPAPASRHTPEQPIRVLQPGQNVRDGGFSFSWSFSPFTQEGQARPEQATHKPNPSTDELGHPPGRSNERKQQLLSLFGKQYGPSESQSHAKAEATKSLVGFAGPMRGDGLPDTRFSSSSRRGTETPMSPADQSFLLKYLQTITNTASK